MTVRVLPIALTTNGAGGGTAQSGAPVNGLVLGIRNPGSLGGSADFVFTADDAEGAGTVVALTNQPGPWSVWCGGSIEAMGPGQSFAGVPVDGHLNVTVASAAAATSGTLSVYAER